MKYKDPLDYTKEELGLLSTEDLIKIQKIADEKNSLFNTAQLVKKLLMNSLYGAFSNKYFPLFNQHMARAITGNGRYFIQKMAKEIESGLQDLIPYDKGYVFYGDTDSVDGSTIINTSQGNVSIENLYDALNGEVEIKDENNFIKHISNNVYCKSFNTSTKSVEDKKIKYIMAHKVKKRMYKIKHNNDEIVVTEDHSVIINRNGNYLDISPKDIKKGDKIVKI
jgi:DNA polymerase elongation subunit (family B)